MTSTFTFTFEIKKSLRVSVGFPGGSVVKNLPANAEDTGLIPDPGERNGSPLSTLAWRTLWTEEPGVLPSMGLQRDGLD